MGRGRVATLTAAIVLALLGLSLPGWNDFQIGAYQDDASYLVLARSIATGERFGQIFQPGPHLPAKFPFVFPLLLAPFAAGDLAMARLVPLVFTVLDVIVLVAGWPLLAGRSSRRWALAVAALYALSPQVVAHSRLVMSEPPFLFFTLTALLLTEWCARGRGGFAAAAGLGASVALAYFTRPVGAVLAVACGGALALGIARRPGALRDFSRVAGGAAAGVLLVLALGFGVARIEFADLLPRYHVTELGEAASPWVGPPPAEEGPRWLRTAAEYAYPTIPAALLPAGLGGNTRERAAAAGLVFLPPLLGGLVLALTLLGAWYAWRRDRLSSAVVLFQLSYGAVLLAWPWAVGRLLYPLLPFLFYEFLMGVALLGRAAGALAGRRHRAGLRRAAVGLVCGLLLALSIVKDLRSGDSREFTLDLEAGAGWLRQNSRPGEIVAAVHGTQVYLYSGLQVVPLPPPGEAAEVERDLERRGVDYVLLAPRLAWGKERVWRPESERLLELLARAGGAYELVYESPPPDRVRVFRRR